MTASHSLPPRPSLESLRKQAKRIARERSVSLRDAQLALAREYGFAGWRDLSAEVSKRVGNDLEWALAEARRVIHDNDIVVLKRLLAEHPALLSWRGDERHQSLMGMATGAYGDAFGPEREHWFTRGTCAELLIDAGAIILPRVSEGIPPVTRGWPAAHVRAQGPAAADADVSGGPRPTRCGSRSFRGERVRSDGAERRVHLRLPLRA
jgi:hypothetical protein